MFYAKTFAKMLQNFFAKHFRVVTFKIKKPLKHFLQYFCKCFILQCNHGLITLHYTLVIYGTSITKKIEKLLYSSVLQKSLKYVKIKLDLKSSIKIVSLELSLERCSVSGSTNVSRQLVP